MTDAHSDIDEMRTIFAGKFRRYHGESFMKRILDIKTNLLNIRDLFYFLFGTLQSIWLVRRLNPNAVFLKGGFVGVPVGLASALWQKPIVTHDSDALPGLANRLISKWADWHATGLPVELYDYPSGKTRYTGVLVTKDYQPTDANLQQQYKSELEVPDNSQLLFVTGGSLGSQVINKALVHIAPKLLQTYPALHIIHQVGKGNDETYGSYRHERLHVLPFLKGMHRYSGAADVIVTRAGANTIAEFGIQRKACIVIPNPFLTGGHQVKNGEYLAAHDAAIVIDEQDLSKTDVLEQNIKRLLDDKSTRDQLQTNLAQLAKPNAAADLASLLLDVIKEEKHV